jgi:hypothetical protein
MNALEKEAKAAREDADKQAMYNGGGSRHLTSELQAEVKALKLEKRVLEEKLRRLEAKCSPSWRS